MRHCECPPLRCEGHGIYECRWRIMERAGWTPPEVALSVADPVVGGLVRVPRNVGSAHVLLSNGDWRVRFELRPDDEIREIGGGALLGSGQIVPIDSVKL